MRARPVLAAIFLTASIARADEPAGAEAPFLYTRYDLAPAPTLRVELESAVGTRDTRPIGHDGVEQAVRVQAGLGALSLEARGGLLLGQSDNAAAVGLEAGYRLLDESRAPVHLTLGAGWGRDYQDVHVLRARVALGKRLGAVDLVGNGLIEVPLSGDRDFVDVIFGVGASYRATAAARVGVELIGEDLEGFWEEDEAEGGAKLLAGPTASYRFTSTFDLKANVGAVIQATESTAATAADTRTGLLARLVLAASF